MMRRNRLQATAPIHWNLRSNFPATMTQGGNNPFYGRLDSWLPMGHAQTYFINRDTGQRWRPPLEGTLRNQYRYYLRTGGFCVHTRWDLLPPGRWQFVMRASNGWASGQVVRTWDFSVVARAPTSVTITNRPTGDQITRGTTRQLGANVLPTNAADRRVEWISGNTRVATVNANGVVSAHATGQVHIVARSLANANVYHRILMTVVAAPAGGGGSKNDVDNIRNRKKELGRVTGWVDTATLNVRSGPSTNHAAVRQLPRDAVVVIVGESGSWWRLQCGNFVHMDFIRFVNFDLTTGPLPAVFNLVHYTRDGDRTRFTRTNLPQGFTRQVFANMQPHDALALLHESRVFIFRGHGNRNRVRTTSIGVYDTPSFESRPLTAGMIRSLPNNSLNRAELVLFAACGGGEGTLVETTFDMGAQIVIGWTATASRVGLCAWTEEFMNTLTRVNPATRQMHTVREAMAAGDVVVRNLLEDRINRNRPREEIDIMRAVLNNQLVRGETNRRFP